MLVYFGKHLIFSDVFPLHWQKPRSAYMLFLFFAESIGVWDSEAPAGLCGLAEVVARTFLSDPARAKKKGCWLTHRTNHPHRQRFLRPSKEWLAVSRRRGVALRGGVAGVALPRGSSKALVVGPGDGLARGLRHHVVLVRPDPLLGLLPGEWGGVRGSTFVVCIFCCCFCCVYFYSGRGWSRRGGVGSVPGDPNPLLQFTPGDLQYHFSESVLLLIGYRASELLKRSLVISDHIKMLNKKSPNNKNILHIFDQNVAYTK